MVICVTDLPWHPQQIHPGQLHSLSRHIFKARDITIMPQLFHGHFLFLLSVLWFPRISPVEEDMVVGTFPSLCSLPSDSLWVLPLGASIDLTSRPRVINKIKRQVGSFLTKAGNPHILYLFHKAQISLSLQKSSFTTNSIICYTLPTFHYEAKIDLRSFCQLLSQLTRKMKLPEYILIIILLP